MRAAPHAHLTAAAAVEIYKAAGGSTASRLAVKVLSTHFHFLFAF
jgi:hypothetical protein